MQSEAKKVKKQNMKVKLMTFEVSYKHVGSALDAGELTWKHTVFWRTANSVFVL